MLRVFSNIILLFSISFAFLTNIAFGQEAPLFKPEYQDKPLSFYDANLDLKIRVKIGTSNEDSVFHHEVSGFFVEYALLATAAYPQKISKILKQTAKRQNTTNENENRYKRLLSPKSVYSLDEKEEKKANELEMFTFSHSNEDVQMAAKLLKKWEKNGCMFNIMVWILMAISAKLNFQMIMKF